MRASPPDNWVTRRLAIVPYSRPLALVDVARSHQKLLRAAARALTATLLVFAALEVAVILSALTDPAVTVGLDFRMYMDRTADFLAGDGFYLPHQLTGPYEVSHGDNMYPPTLLYFTVPFVYLPAVLWWVIPLGVIAGVIAYLRPSPWQWVALAAILVYPRTWTILLYGNPAMWALMFLTLGMVRSYFLVGAALKLTFAPFALLGIRDERWWYVAWGVSFACIPFGFMWIDYAKALVNAQTSRGLEYTLGEWPIAILLVLGLTRARLPVGWSWSRPARRTGADPAP